MADVFVSHATKDDTTVSKIHDELEKLTGTDLWVDHKDIKTGMEWQEEIETHLKTCGNLLLVVSRNSMASDEVTAEWRAALTYGHKMLLAIIDDIPIEDIYSRLRLIQWVNLKNDWNGGIQQLADAITGKASADDAPSFRMSFPITGTMERELTLTPMCGRDDDLKAVHDALRGKRPVFIIGVGGLGKSRLAAEALLTGDMANGAIWHRLSDVSRPEAVIELLRQHFHLEPTVDRPQVLEKLRQYQRIVVLDNAEDVPENDPRRADYVRLINELHAHDARVIVTSRMEWADVRAVSKVEPTQLSPDPARQVVLDMAEAYKVALGDAPDQSADAIAQGARFHPRLIEWAIGQMERKPVARVLETLQSLSSRKAQEALYEMVGKTHEQMIAQEEHGALASQLLARLLVTRGGFTYEAGAYICGAGDGGKMKEHIITEFRVSTPDDIPDTDEDDFEEALETLTRWRFLSYQSTTQRYSIAPVVREALRADDDAHKAHYDYYYALAYYHDEKQDYFGLDVESDNLVTAFDWALRTGRAEDALWFFNTWYVFLANRGRFTQHLDSIERVVQALQNDGASEQLLANAQNTLGNVYQEHPHGERVDNLQGAIHAYREALRFWTAERAPMDYAMTQNNLGSALSDLAELADDDSARREGLNEAITAYREALRFRTAQINPQGYSMTQNNLGTTLSDLATLADDDSAQRAGLHEAIQAYREALRFWTVERAPMSYAMTQNNLGGALCHLALLADDDSVRRVGLNEAIQAYQRALTIDTPQSNPYGYAQTQANLGIAYKDLGDIDRALACYHEAERYFRQVGHMAQADRVRGWIDYYEAQSGGDGEEL